MFIVLVGKWLIIYPSLCIILYHFHYYNANMFDMCVLNDYLFIYLLTYLLLQAAAAATTQAEPSHVEEKSAAKPRRSTLSDSSDSAEEPTDPSRRDPDVRYLTSRATSPMDPAERDVFLTTDKSSSSGKAKTRNRLLARTKTKKYPVGDRKRRRQLKDVSIQVAVT